MISGAAFLLAFAACTQDEITDGNALPEGKYPVEIAFATIGGEGSGQPWGARSPQTRAVDEEYNGEIRTLWRAGDIFYMKFKDGDDIGSNTIASDGYGVDRGRTLYWRSATQKETLVSWFTQPSLGADGGMLDISNQAEGLAYVCREEQDVKYGGGDITVVLKHQLAKVRVYVQGTGYEGDAVGVSINGVPVTCTVEEGVPTTSGETGTIIMHPTTVNNATCFEANLLPGTLDKDVTFSIDGIERPVSLDNDMKLTDGKIYTVNLRLQKENTQIIDLSTGDKEITGDGLYFFTGTGTHSIKVKSGSPKIYLANADIRVTSGHAIEISGGSPTFVIQGSTEVQSSVGAGIYVSNGSITIKTDNKSDNRLTARGGSDTQHVYPGIGGAVGTNINIDNIYLYAYGSKKDDNYSPAIGAAQPIGGSSSNPPKVNLSNCEIWAYRVMIPGDSWYMRSYADHIGQGGNADNPHGYANGAQVNLGSGSNSSSRVYCYSDDRFNGEY